MTSRRKLRKKLSKDNYRQEPLQAVNANISRKLFFHISVFDSIL